MFFFDDSQDALEDILSIWRDEYPFAYPHFAIEQGKIRFYFTDAVTLRSSPESKWFNEEDVWRLDVELSEIDEEAARLLKELYAPTKRHLRLVKG